MEAIYRVMEEILQKGAITIKQEPRLSGANAIKQEPIQ
jgi:hypothetical protein